MSDLSPEESTAREIALEDYRANMEDAGERLRYQVQFSQAALKNLHLVNGGAVLALLTFLGHTDLNVNYRAIWWAFVWFGLGLATSLASYFGAYFSQAHFMNVSIMEAWNAQQRARGLPPPHDYRPHFRVGNLYMYLGIAAAVVSLALFVIGAFVGLSGLSDR